jgi:hypothetical protein
MYWKAIIILAVLAVGFLSQGDRKKDEQKRKQDLNDFEQRKQSQEENEDPSDCPCRPGGCC